MGGAWYLGLNRPAAQQADEAGGRHRRPRLIAKPLAVEARVSRVDLGYFQNFKSSDTLLMEGDADGLRNLARVLRSLESGSAAVVEIDGLPFVWSHHGVRLGPSVRAAIS